MSLLGCGERDDGGGEAVVDVLNILVLVLVSLNLLLYKIGLLYR